MTVTVNPSLTVVEGWVFTNTDERFHVSVANLPLKEWHPASTMCRIDADLFRLGRPPSYHQRAKVCRGCVRELLTMAEVLPSWMEALR